MEWVGPILVETRELRESVMEDGQAIAQALSTAAALHEQLVALAHSTELGIHQLQQELHLTSAIKAMLEESGPSFDAWPDNPQEDVPVGGVRPDLSQGILAHPDLFFSCSQGVIVDSAAAADETPSASLLASCGWDRGQASTALSGTKVVDTKVGEPAAPRLAIAGPAVSQLIAAAPAVSQLAASGSAEAPPLPQPTAKMDTCETAPGADAVAEHSGQAATSRHPPPEAMTMLRVGPASGLEPATSARPPGDALSVGGLPMVVDQGVVTAAGAVPAPAEGKRPPEDCRPKPTRPRDPHEQKPKRLGDVEYRVSRGGGGASPA